MFSEDSLQLAEMIVRCSKRNGADNAAYAAAGLAELRRRFALLERLGITDHPYEDAAVKLLGTEGVEF